MRIIDRKGSTCLFNKSEFHNYYAKKEKVFKRAVDDDSDEDACDRRKRIKLGTPNKIKELLNKSFVVIDERKKSVAFTSPAVKHKSCADKQLSPASDLSEYSTEETDSEDEIDQNLEPKLLLSPMDYSPKLNSPKPSADKTIIQSDVDKTPAKMNISASTISPKTPNLTKWRSTKSNTPFIRKTLQTEEDSDCEDESQKPLNNNNVVLSEELLRKFEYLTIRTPKHFNKLLKRTDISPKTTPVKTKTDDPNSTISKTTLNAPKKTPKYQRDLEKETMNNTSNNSPLFDCGESPILRLVKRENMLSLQSEISRTCINLSNEESPLHVVEQNPPEPKNLKYDNCDSPKVRKIVKGPNRSLVVRFVENLDCSASEAADELELVMRYRPGKSTDDLNNNTPRYTPGDETPRSSKKKPRVLFKERIPNLNYI